MAHIRNTRVLIVGKDFTKKAIVIIAQNVMISKV
jgi:hypothetical protein